MWPDDEPTEHNPFTYGAFPDVFGGVSVLALMNDGATLCEQCTRDPNNPVWDARKVRARATVQRHPSTGRFEPFNRGSDADGWGVVAFYTTQDSDDLEVCDHCGKVVQEAWTDD